ncbi:hypothetical protein CPB86DRAFT_876304 [Serendipita vermifera]|nr:hypothetical protein CPB86DRAFT_876304 [Serendipita vermifera]
MTTLNPPKSFQDMLPVELWHQIFAHATASSCRGQHDCYNRTADGAHLNGSAFMAFVGDELSRQNLSLVSRTFRALSEPIRYHNVISINAERVKQRLSTASIANPTRNRSTYVRGIFFIFPPATPPVSQIASFETLLALCPNILMVLVNAHSLEQSVLEFLMTNLPRSTRALTLKVSGRALGTQVSALAFENIRALNLLGWSTLSPLQLTFSNLETLRITTSVRLAKVPLVSSLKHVHIRYHTRQEMTQSPDWVTRLLDTHADTLEILTLDTVGRGSFALSRPHSVPLLSAALFNKLKQLRELVFSLDILPPFTDTTVKLPALRYIGIIVEEYSTLRQFIDKWNWCHLLDVSSSVERFIVSHSHERTGMIDEINSLCGYDRRLMFQCNLQGSQY